MRGRNIYLACVFILLGIFFLLNNFGFLQWDFWLVFGDFWPLILIAMGFRLLFKRNVVIQVLSLLIIFVIPLVYYFTGYETPFISDSRGYEVYRWSAENEEGYSEAKLDLNLTYGELNLKSSEKLVEIEAKSVLGKPDIKVNNDDEQVEVIINSRNKKKISSYSPLKKHNEVWEIGLGIKEKWDLDINTGAMTGKIDLRKLNVKKLDLDMGAGNLECFYGKIVEESHAKIEAGAGNIKIYIPHEVGVRAKIETGVGNKNITGRDWEKNGNVYTSKNFEEAPNKLYIHVQAGAGNISIVTEKWSVDENSEVKHI